MHNELNRSIAQEQYQDMIRQARQRALITQTNVRRPRLLQASARIVAKLLLASGEQLRRYSEPEAAQVQLSEVARHA